MQKGKHITTSEAQEEERQRPQTRSSGQNGEPLLPRHREAAEHLAAVVNSVQSSKSPSTEKWLLEILIRQSSDINIFKVRNKK